MTNLLHSISPSYTEHKAKNQHLGRGLLRDRAGDPIPPEKLAEFVASDLHLVLRQTIGVLDKVVQKKKFLRYMSYEAYLHRAKLAERIWQELMQKFSELKVETPQDQKAALRIRWDNKAHPYQLDEPNGLNPEADANGQFLSNREMNSAEGARAFSEFQGKWFDKFWEIGGDPVNYSRIAKAIIGHLFDQELLMKGGPRKEKRNPEATEREATKRGLMTARGRTASKSAHNPQLPSNKDKYPWDLEATKWYFRKKDVAADIHDKIKNLNEQNERINAQWFGHQLYDHLGALGGLPPEPAKKQNLWNFHNAVRDYYKDIANSERFRRAVRGSKDGEKRETSKLLEIVPANKEILAGRLANANLPMGGQNLNEFYSKGGVDGIRLSKGNADVSRAIRLGKLVIHAADAVADDGKPDQVELDQAMKRLATSHGQSEIKRLETSARIWRRATALSTRTLKAFVDPKGEVLLGNNNSDVTAHNVAQKALKNVRGDAWEMITAQSKTIFGEKMIEGDLQNKSRVSIFQNDDGNFEKEHIWAFLKITKQVRNAVFHFNVRRRLVQVLKGGIVDLVQTLPRNLDKAKSTISFKSNAALKNLLSFDQGLRKYAVEADLAQISADKYLNKDQLKVVIEQIACLPISDSLMLPRFGAVVKRVSNLAKENNATLHPDLKTLSQLKIGNEDGSQDVLNQCKLGICRQLYSTGFRAWLETQFHDETLYSETIKKIVTSKEKRVDAFQNDAGRKSPTIIELVEKLGLDNYKNIVELSNALASETIRNTGQDQKYEPNRKIQRNSANDIEAFRQEFFAHIFAKYIGVTHLDWVFGLSAEISDTEGVLSKAMSAFSCAEALFDEDWHAQFYGWLYMVPPEEASLLRHQIRKTIVLEEKGRQDEGLATDAASGETINVFAQIEQLIGLYTKVQSTGFQGDEHVGALVAGASFYEDPDDFKEIYSDEIPSTEATDHKLSAAGTRRGLRQLVRYSHLKVLRPIFENHLISKGEVEAFTATTQTGNADMMGEYHKLRRDIIKAEKSNKRNEDRAIINAKPKNIRQYKQTAIAVCKYNFDIKAARLTDHIQLHRMMMQVVGRLTDYTAMWERDRLYAFVGLLIGQDEDFKIRLLVNDLGEMTLKAKSQYIGEEIEIQVFTNDHGFNSANYTDLSEALTGGKKAIFKRLFCSTETMNPIDKLHPHDLYDWPSKGRKEYKGKATIRNDLAHQNVLDHADPRLGPRLTYVVNAVRSLMAYDKKQKNVVPKSIKRILGEYGLCIDWNMSSRDRLTKPFVYPAKETHLGFCRQNKGEEFVKFDVPRASPRLASMAQALFDISSSGHTKIIIENKKKVGRKIWYHERALEGYIGDLNAVRIATNHEFRFRNEVNI